MATRGTPGMRRSEKWIVETVHPARAYRGWELPTRGAGVVPLLSRTRKLNVGVVKTSSSNTAANSSHEMLPSPLVSTSPMIPLAHAHRVSPLPIPASESSVSTLPY